MTAPVETEAEELAPAWEWSAGRDGWAHLFAVEGPRGRSRCGQAYRTILWFVEDASPRCDDCEEMAARR